MFNPAASWYLLLLEASKFILGTAVMTVMSKSDYYWADQGRISGRNTSRSSSRGPPRAAPDPLPPAPNTATRTATGGGRVILRRRAAAAQRCTGMGRDQPLPPPAGRAWQAPPPHAFSFSRFVFTLVRLCPFSVSQTL